MHIHRLPGRRPARPRAGALARPFILAAAVVLAWPASAKLPALSDEAKAKAAEAAAKAAWGGKLADFQLCKAMDRTAARYHAAAKQAGKESKAPVETPACADPGPFVAPAPATAAPKT